MGTKDFNVFDKLIAKLRLSKIMNESKINSCVLDFGCGSQAYFLKQISQSIRLGYGLDYDVDDTSFNNLVLKKFNFIDKLPFTNDYFDSIFMLAVLEHIDPNKVDLLFKEFSRVLKTKGKIVMTTPTQLSKPLLELLASLNIINKDEIKDHKKYYSESDVLLLGKNNGFSVSNYELFQFGLNSKIVFVK